MKKHIKTFLLITVVIVAILATYLINAGIKDYRINKDIAESITGRILPKVYKPILANEFNNDGNKITRMAMLLAPQEHTILLIEGPLLETSKDQKDFISSLSNKLRLFKDNKFKHLGNIVKTKPIKYNNSETISYTIQLKSGNKKTLGNMHFINYSNHSLLVIVLSKNTSFDSEVFKEFLENINLP